MSDMHVPLYVLACIFFLIAFFYSSVGLGGGSSYTALLAVAGCTATAIPMISLSLNLLVTTVGSIAFFRRRHTRIHLVAPFLISSIPMAYIGGTLQVSKELFFILLWGSLVFAVWRIYFPGDVRPFPLTPLQKFFFSLVGGGILGFIAGMVGIGGGVYLVPLIILLGLGSAKEAAACGAVFIWVNSLFGLAARLQYNPIDLKPFLPLVVMVLAGGLFGSFMGSSCLAHRSMEKILGSILVVAVLLLGRKIVGIYA